MCTLIQKKKDMCILIQKKNHVHSNQIGLATIPYRKLGSFGCGYILVYLAHSMKAPKLNTPKNHMRQSKFRVGLDDKI